MALNYIIDVETAKKEFENICDFFEVDINENEMELEEKKDFYSIKRIIIKAIRLGRLYIDSDSGEINYKISENSENYANEILIIKRPKGADELTTDQYKEQKYTHKYFTLVASMIKKPIQFISKLDAIDVSVLKNMALLFFGG